MCTVTIAALSAPSNERGLRLACNRDESRRRAIALPPALHKSNGPVVLAPIDPESGGTWIAVNDRGLVCTLLNGNPPRRPAKEGRNRSRGTIIPSLWSCSSAFEAAKHAAGIDPREFMPFRLVLADGDRVVSLFSDGGRVHRFGRSMEQAPHFFTSSGLGDAIVDPPRRALFEQFRRDGRFVKRQNAFHTHRWSERGHLSICMSRSDACTVSTCVVEVTATRVRMQYAGVEPASPIVTLEIPRSGREPERE